MHPAKGLENDLAQRDIRELTLMQGGLSGRMVKVQALAVYSVLTAI